MQHSSTSEVQGEPQPLSILAERCEAATAEQQKALLTDAFRAISSESGQGIAHSDWDKWERYSAWLARGAFVDAALTLVPEGCGLHTAAEYGEQRVPGSSKFKLTGRHWARVYTPHHGSFENYAATLALAICAAALRAHNQSE